ncbi:E3 ubiquitin-protein ligase TRIM56-like [Acanthaster planci]|uniref:E3 ubiquitin-protein ligase TRIM56-like n=1 Tax=Acanthaster planci TaxID=133434 RepID=A0A8B8A2K4_ACAPL|nr:E3 ubiquitin-protein ligase TRIM56-like [Acanthaster planci]
MATGSAVSSALETISRHHLECPICSDRFQRPKILDCLHSFCEQCLLTYCSTKHQGCTEIPCPVCRQESQLPEAGVTGLKTNFYLIGLVEEIELQEKLLCSGETKLLCETCDDGNEATHRCLDCERYMCTTCKKNHPRIPALSNHTIATLDEIRAGKAALSRKHSYQHRKCPNHEGEVMRFFCTTCEKPICRDCTVIDHRQPEHTYIDKKQAASTYKQSLADLFRPVEEILNNFHTCLKTVSMMKNDFHITVKTAIAGVQDKAGEIRAEVTAQENRIIDDIQNIQSDP